jgi:branched-chain amino acid aminotransferase
MTTVIWVDGRVVEADSARVPALDHGLTVGDGAFETCKVVDGEVFALTRHLRRLSRSLSILGLPPVDDGRLRDAVEQAVAAAGRLPLARLRITVTGGPGPLGSDRGSSGPTLVVAVSATSPWPARIAVVTVPWTRNENSAVAGAKTTSYAENVVALNAAHARGAHEALLANTRGMLCEGTGSNVFVGVGDRLLTPPLTAGCLGGITRELLLEWAAEEGLPVAEEDLPLDVLDTADDVLLTSSTRDVQPVAVLDGRELAGGTLGREAVELFARRAARGTDPGPTRHPAGWSPH